MSEETNELFSEELNQERFFVQQGEFRFFDDNGRELKGSEIRSFLLEKKRQIEEKNKDRGDIKFIALNNIVKIKNNKDLLYLISCNVNPNGDYLYDYCAVKYNSEDKTTKYYFDHEDIELVYVKKVKPRKDDSFVRRMCLKIIKALHKK